MSTPLPRRDTPAATGRSTAVADFLNKLQPVAARAGNGRGRLITALDATASRQPTWDMAATVTHAMFDVVMGLGGLDVQLLFFRGFDECKASRWVTSGAALHQLMRGVRCDAGITQITRVLDHCLAETRRQHVAAVVFIGDAMEEDPERLYCQARDLGNERTPVIIFQEGYDPSTWAVFQQIASRSGGACLGFDLANIDRLKELLAAVAVYATGGHAALETYAERQGGEVLRLAAQLHQ